MVVRTRDVVVLAIIDKSLASQFLTRRSGDDNNSRQGPFESGEKTYDLRHHFIIIILVVVQANRFMFYHIRCFIIILIILIIITNCVKRPKRWKKVRVVPSKQ
jgi:hypothetical protein